MRRWTEALIPLAQQEAKIWDLSRWMYSVENSAVENSRATLEHLERLLRGPFLSTLSSLDQALLSKWGISHCGTVTVQY